MAPKKLTYKPGDGCYASATTVALRLTPFDPAQDVFANISQTNLNTWGSSAGPGLLGHITRAADAAKRCARQNRAFPEPSGGGYTLTYEEMLRTSTMKITPTFRKMCKDLGGVEDFANPWRTLCDGFLDVHATTGCSYEQFQKLSVMWHLEFLTGTWKDTVFQLFLHYNQFELPHEYPDGGEALTLWKAECVLERVYGLLDEARQSRLRMLARKRALLLEQSHLREELSQAMIRPSTPPLWEELRDSLGVCMTVCLIVCL